MINLSMHLKHHLTLHVQRLSLVCYFNVGLLLVVCLGACSQVPGGLDIPPPPNDPNLSAANQAFLKGDWNTLKALLSRLPGDGVLLPQSLFYQAVILGFEKPKKAAKDLKALQLGNNKRLKQRATLYRLLFKARAGECLLTEGPLRRVYWPKAKTLPQGTRLLLEEALRGCDERNQAQHDQVKRLDATVKVIDRPKVESSFQIKTEPIPTTINSNPTEQVTQDLSSEKTPNKEGADQSSGLTHLNQLTVEQRRGVTPYLQLWLPLDPSKGQQAAKRSPLNIVLAESAPLFVDQREEQGERVELERLDIQLEGKDSVSTRTAELRSEVDALLVVTPSKALHQEVLANVKTQQRPLFIFTPYQIDTEHADSLKAEQVSSKAQDTQPDDKSTTVKAKDDANQDNSKSSAEAPIWRIFPDKNLISRSLVKIACQNESQGVGVLLPEGQVGMQLLKKFQSELKKHGQEKIKYRMLSSNENWETLAKELRKWPIDTLIFTQLPTLSVTSLVTHLASKGVWSASSKRFSQNLMDDEEEGKDLYRRFILWPSLYEQSVLDQVGRYLEGARTVSPVFKESESFKALDQKLLKEVGRGAQILDALLQDVLLFVDEAIRLSEVKQISLSEAFTKLSIQTKYLINLDFTKKDALQKLYEIEVHNQKFRLFESTPKEPVNVNKVPKQSPQIQPDKTVEEDLNKEDAKQAD